MKLYYVVGSPNCRKVHAVANHLGVRLAIEYLDFFAGDHKRAEYLALNANGMVPTFVDGDLVLSESNAIMQYLADGVPGNTLLTTDRAVRARINHWQSWELAHFNKAFGVLAFEAVAKPTLMNLPSDTGLVEWSRNELARFAPVLEHALAGRCYLVGETLTLADYSVVHLEMFKDAVPFDWQPFPNINEYFARVRAEPSWAATAPPSPDAIGKRPAAA